MKRSLLVLGLAACAPAPATPVVTNTAALEAKPVLLPFASPPSSMDYIACDRERGTVWAPVASAKGGSVAVIDASTMTLTHVVDGFKTTEREVKGRKRIYGPSAVSLGNQFAYVGNRATNEVCRVDIGTKTLGDCKKLEVSLDGLAWIEGAKELWVTSPVENALTILDANLEPKAKVALAGAPEGFAFDDATHTFFTNLEDKDSTVAIDIASHAITATWQPHCGEEGPRGIAVDGARGFLLVACTDRVQVLDRKRSGVVVSSVEVGGGVDNIDYVAAKELVYAAASKDARLVVLHLDEKGHLQLTARVKTEVGARNAVVDARGTAFLTDAANGRLLAVPKTF